MYWKTSCFLDKGNLVYVRWSVFDFYEWFSLPCLQCGRTHMWGWDEVRFCFQSSIEHLFRAQPLMYKIRPEWEVMNCAANPPVAADLNLLRETYWTSWTLLPGTDSRPALPAATRGWYRYHSQLSPLIQWDTFCFKHPPFPKSFYS